MRAGGPADLRLVGFALGMWGASLIALRVSAGLAVALAFAAASVAATAALVRGRGPVRHRAPAHLTTGRTPVRVASARTLAVAVSRGAETNRARGVALVLAGIGVLLGVVCGLLSTAARTASRDAEPLAGLARSHAAVLAELTVTDDPRPLAGGGAGPATYMVPATLTLLDRGSDVFGLDDRVLVFATAPQWRDLLPSQRVSATGTLAAARGGDLTAAVLIATGPPTTVESPSWTQRAAGRLRAGLQAACRQLPPAPGGLLPGLVIGDTSQLDPALAEQFRATGLTHLVAVSGANV
jgi:competence protein ComEC